MKKDDLITVYDSLNNPKKYKLLAIYDNKYIIYKDVDNKSNKENLYASKIILDNDKMKLDKLSDSEWKIIEKEYKILIENIY